MSKLQVSSYKAIIVRNQIKEHNNVRKYLVTISLLYLIFYKSNPSFIWSNIRGIYELQHTLQHTYRFVYCNLYRNLVERSH